MITLTPRGKLPSLAYLPKIKLVVSGYRQANQSYVIFFVIAPAARTCSLDDSSSMAPAPWLSARAASTGSAPTAAAGALVQAGDPFAAACTHRHRARAVGHCRRLVSRDPMALCPMICSYPCARNTEPLARVDIPTSCDQDLGEIAPLHARCDASRSPVRPAAPQACCAGAAATPRRRPRTLPAAEEFFSHEILRFFILTLDTAKYK